MHYYIIEEDIDMVINEWDNEWRILAITQEMSETTAEEEARK
jgi:hypothetical protein